MRTLYFLFLLALLLLPLLVDCDCDCSTDDEGRDRAKAQPLKIAAFFSILVAGVIGVSLPILSKWVPALSPEKDVFLFVKAFAAGVILATGFIHILPDAMESLTSPCLSEDPWGKFPFAGFVAMFAAVGTLMVDALATGYYSRSQPSKEELPVSSEMKGDAQAHTHKTDPNNSHAHAHAHAHGSAQAQVEGYGSSEQIRHRIIAQVLEMGIIVHSVIIGISLGASENPSAIKPLVAALSFHQMFEGMGLGGSIAQAKFKVRSMVTMVLFFTLTTPGGIVVGMAISSVYSETSPTALIVQGILDSAAAGILIYMSLVDLLAADLMHPRVQSKGRLQLGIHASLLLGAGLMSLLAKWA